MEGRKMRTGLDRIIDGYIRLNMPVGEIIDNLVNNYTTRALTEQLANTCKENAELKERSASLVRISQEDFENHFRIIGKRSDGTEETRGRKWNKET